LGGVLGLSFKDGPAAVSDSEIKQLIAKREELRKQRKYKEADEIREELKKKGIIIEDGKGATYLRRGD